MFDPEAEPFIAFAKHLASVSAEVIRPYFRAPLTVEMKEDETPVTIADRKAEEVMRTWIEREFPEHGIVGEEGGTLRPEAEFVWVLDPIDGTKSFVTGVPLFGTLIALVRRGVPLLGVIHHPVLDLLVVGTRTETRVNDVPARVRVCTEVSEATLLTTDPWGARRYQDGPAFEAFSRRVKLYRSWGDCFGYTSVASGYADIMVDPAVAVWDAMAVIPVIQGAGGVITDYRGGDPTSGNGLIATAGPLHAEVVRALNPGS